MNLYSDFHSRGGAPDAQPFYTLQEHQERLEAKLAQLEGESEHMAGDPDVKLASATKLPAAVGAAKEKGADGAVKATPNAKGRPALGAGEKDVKHVRQHLVLQRWEPAVSDELDMFDRNLGGKRLLPHLEPFD